MKTRYIPLALLALLLLDLAVPLSGGPPEAARVLRSGSLSEPSSLDPACVWDDTSSFYVNNIFDTLVRLDPRTMKIEPSLASSWETSQDGRTWTFNLRRGVRFHDGTPCGAEAVAFSFFRQMDPANPDRRTAFPMFAEIFTHLTTVKKTGPYQVQFILSEPFFPFLASLTVECAAIVSPTAVKKLGAGFARHPVGTGPFKLNSWQKGKRLVLAANPDYWRGRPAIDEYVDIIEPQSEMLNKRFLDGALDILSTYSISKMVGYKKLDWVQVIAAPYLSVTYVVINSARLPLQRKGVRQALGHAWDPRTLKLVFQDYVLPIHSLLPRGLMEGEDEARPSGFSLAKARELLNKETGGAELQLEFLLLKDDGLIFQLLSIYAANLKQIGVKLKLTRLEPDVLAARIAAGDFDLAYSGWIADYPDPDSMLSPLLSEPLLKQGFANAATGKRQDLIEKLILARRERNAGQRHAIYRAIDRILIGDGLVIPLYQDKRVIIFNRRVENIRPNPLGKLYLFDLKMK
jgi:peptide/nickel transport system substrate-binding protein